jgi:hypothetical protein
MNFSFFDKVALGIFIVVTIASLGVKDNMGKLILLAAIIAAMYWHTEVLEYFGSAPKKPTAQSVVVGAPHSNNPPVISSGNMGQVALPASAPALITKDEQSSITKWLIDHTPGKK